MAQRRSFRPKYVVIFLNKKIVVFDGNLMIYFNTLYHYSAPLQLPVLNKLNSTWTLCDAQYSKRKSWTSRLQARSGFKRNTR